MMAHNEVYLRCAQLANASRVRSHRGQGPRPRERAAPSRSRLRQIIGRPSDVERLPEQRVQEVERGPLRRRRPWLRRGGLAEGASSSGAPAGEVAGTLARRELVPPLAVGIAGGAAYGLARGTGWVLENTLFRPQQGSEDAAAQDVRSANIMNNATQPQHFTLRTGSTSGSLFRGGFPNGFYST